MDLGCRRIAPRRAFTVEDVRRMVEVGIIAEGERIELVEGELVVMAAKGYSHELVKLAFADRRGGAIEPGL
jgi:hypothetical protein